MAIHTLTWLDQWQQQATDTLAGRLLPDRKAESWRFTDLSALKDATFSTEPEDVVSGDLTATVLAANGRYGEADLGGGAWAKPFASVSDAALIRDRLQHHASDIFALRNAASFRDGLVIYVPANVQVAAPVVLDHWTAPGQLTTPRCLVILERGSELTLIESYRSEGFSNAVTEIDLGENAGLTHCLSQTGTGIHILNSAIAQAADSRYHSYSLSSGQRLSRHSPTISQLGSHCETRLYGLTLAQSDQVADTHSAILHLQPHGSSEQLHKCILRDRAEAIFRGKVRVEAQKINSSQASRTLLRSNKARIDSQPQLEILADDVKCTHGATVGELEASEVFYLQSRGLDYEAAVNLLTFAFAAEIVEAVPVASLRQHWQTLLH